jgi:hypothetical protein
MPVTAHSIAEAANLQSRDCGKIQHGPYAGQEYVVIGQIGFGRGWRLVRLTDSLGRSAVREVREQVLEKE